MCAQVLVVLGGDLDEELVPLYRRAEEEGALSIVGYARPTECGLSFEGMNGEVSVQRVPFLLQTVSHDRISARVRPRDSACRTARRAHLSDAGARCAASLCGKRRLCAAPVGT